MVWVWGYGVDGIKGYGVGNHPAWYFIIQPFVAGAIGYITNALALIMTFHPIEYIGLNLYRIANQPWGFFGWQGIIPTKAEKMASVCFELMTTKLLNLREIFNRLEPTQFSSVMEDALLLMLDDIVNNVALQYIPKTWSNVPRPIKDEIIVIMNIESEKFMSSFMTDVTKHVDDILDIKQMTVEACVRNKQLVNSIFEECGAKEFKFIRESGLYFGFAFGVLQMIISYWVDDIWLLPVAGFLVGYATNWLALKVIFRPLKPRQLYCGCTIHGLFLQRQIEVSETFARVICVDILHTKAMWERILTGPLSTNFYAMLRAHSILFTDNLVGKLKPFAVSAVGGSTKFIEMKEEIARQIAISLPTIMPHSYKYTTEALDIERTIREKMQQLSSPEFEGVLHPAFEEDELLLIIIGGVFGALVGLIQMSIPS